MTKNIRIVSIALLLLASPLVTSAQTTLSINSISGPTYLDINETGGWDINVTHESQYLSYSVYWGDENLSASAAQRAAASAKRTSSSFSHKYTREGTYYPSFYVYDQYGNSTYMNLQVQVVNDMSGKLSAAPRSGSAPLTVKFSSVRASTDTSTYTMYFGDGNSGLMSTCFTPSPEPTCTMTADHTYNYDGEYWASIVNTSTSETLAFKSIRVGSGPGSGINAISGPVSLSVNETGYWSVQVVNPAKYISYGVSWGDTGGLGSPATRGATQTSAAFSHKYTSAGTYYPVFWAYDSNGSFSSAGLQVEVSTPVNIDSATINPDSLVSSSGWITLSGTAHVAGGFVNVSILNSEGGQIFGGGVRVTNDKWSVTDPVQKPNGDYPVRVYADNEKTILLASGTLRVNVTTAVKFAIGDRVRTTDKLVVRDAPGGNRVGGVGANWKGSIIGGPTTKGKNTWWQINWSIGGTNTLGGWSAETYLEKAPPKFDKGYSVTATDRLVVRDAPAGARVGVQKAGALGTIIGGPTDIKQNSWWKVDWNEGVDGASVETYLAMTPTPLPTPPPTASSDEQISNLANALAAIESALRALLERLGK